MSNHPPRSDFSHKVYAAMEDLRAKLFPRAPIRLDSIRFNALPLHSDWQRSTDPEWDASRPSHSHVLYSAVHGSSVPALSINLSYTGASNLVRESASWELRGVSSQGPLSDIGPLSIHFTGNAATINASLSANFEAFQDGDFLHSYSQAWLWQARQVFPLKHPIIRTLPSGVIKIIDAFYTPWRNIRSSSHTVYRSKLLPQEPWSTDPNIASDHERLAHVYQPALECLLLCQAQNATDASLRPEQDIARRVMKFLHPEHPPAPGNFVYDGDQNPYASEGGRSVSLRDMTRRILNAGTHAGPIDCSAMNGLFTCLSNLAGSNLKLQQCSMFQAGAVEPVGFDEAMVPTSPPVPFSDRKFALYSYHEFAIERDNSTVKIWDAVFNYYSSENDALNNRSIRIMGDREADAFLPLLVPFNERSMANRIPRLRTDIFTRKPI